jgi:chemotaxis protein CheD
MRTNFNSGTIIYLHPGEVFYSNKPFIVSTILGSCLSITMFSERIPLAGITHCQLPKCTGLNDNCENCLEPYKYVDCSIKKMLEKFNEHKIKPFEIDIKLFGGADVLSNFSDVENNSVGKQNIAVAKRIINKNNLNLVASDVGGKQGRKIYFNSKTGGILLYRMNRNEQSKSINSR